MIHRRVAWFVIGATSLALGAIGVVLPLLPTTPFVLLAAYAFAQSSERCHNWLLEHPLFGKLIADWREYGAIGRRSKIISVVSMIAILLLSFLLQLPRVVLLIQAAVLCATAAFILSRPLPPLAGPANAEDA